MKSSTSYLRHILDETAYLLDASKGLELSGFLADDFKQDHPDIEWRKMAGTRDRLIHGYFSIDHELVWDIVKNKIPALHEKIRSLLD